MNKMSQSGTFYKIVVTCVLLSAHLSLAQDLGEVGSLSNNGPLVQFAPTREASSGLVGSELSSASNLGINSEYNSYFEEGASPSSHPGFVDSPQRGQFYRRPVVSLSAFPPAGGELQTAAQSYFIEPEQPTTTARPKATFKKRKTHRPITFTNDKKKAELETDGFNNNEPPQGGPTYNPFRQIVNTSFARKRPSSSSDGKQGRSRSRAKLDVPSVDNNNEPNEKLNEIPSSTEGGPPRALSRRRPAQDVRPISRPTTTFSSAADNTDPAPPPPPSSNKRFTPRKPVDGSPTNEQRSRNFARRPRPTTTIPSDDDGTETSQPPQQPRRQPAVRPFGVSRFANTGGGGRKTGFPTTTTTTSPSSDSDDAQAPPAQLPRRRPNRRPTTTAEALSSQADPREREPTNAPSSTSAPVTENVGDDTLPSPPKPIREGRQGFILRPRPTQQAPPETVGGDENDGRLLTAQEIIATAKPNLIRRRKRPTTTNGPAADSDQNQDFGGPAPNNDVVPARRAPSVFRGRPTQPPNAYQVRDEQPTPQQVSGAFGNSEDFGGRSIPTSQNSQANLALMRRPTGPDSHQSQGPSLQHNFNNDPSSMLDSSFVPGLFPISSPGNFYSGLDNGLGAVPGNFVPGNFRQGLNHNQFSSRAAPSNEENEPEISDSDTAPSATEKQAVVSTPENSDAEENKPAQKLSPLQRLQNNRQAAARRFLTPRKPTEKTTPAPSSSSQKGGKNARKSLIPPRMLRPRGKLVEEKAAVNKVDEAQENSSAGGGEEKSKEEGVKDSVNDSNASSTSSGTDETDSSNVVPNDEQQASSSKPSILENAKRRRVALPGNRSPSSPGGSQQKLKITPAPPPDHNPDAPPPNCEGGQRYSKFLKRCVTMYKPKAQG